MIIDVIDMEDPVLGSDRLTRLEAARADSLKLIMYGMSNGVAQMISDIGRQTPRGSLEVLRIWSHGRPGGQTVSGGHGGEAYRVAHWTGISTANIGAMQDILAQLRPFFAPGAHVELRGCEVGQGADGEGLLQALARIWGAPVQAGVVTQYHINWDGPVVEASPSGGLRSVVGTPIKTR